MTRKVLDESFADFLAKHQKQWAFYRATSAMINQYYNLMYGPMTYAFLDMTIEPNRPSEPSLPQPMSWWEARKKRSLEIAGYKCEAVGCDHDNSWMLQMHHLNMARSHPRYNVDEKDEEVQILCFPCHKRRHPHMTERMLGPDGKTY